ncbi:hypothetical protein AL480_21270 [Stenotrophomonas maltophilia]|nr:hypothetical protein AL480_21270 [Stenotrophomonas maltophilia]
MPAAGRQPPDLRTGHAAAGQRPALPARGLPTASFSFPAQRLLARATGPAPLRSSHCAPFASRTVSINAARNLPRCSCPAPCRAIHIHMEAPCAVPSSCSPPTCSPSAWASAWASTCCRS